MDSIQSNEAEAFHTSRPNYAKEIVNHPPDDIIIKISDEGSLYPHDMNIYNVNA